MIRDWMHIASRRPIVMRGMKYVVVVGSILIVINHGNAIAAGTVDSTRIVQMILTLLVPYCVSTASSVGAIVLHGPHQVAPNSTSTGSSLRRTSDSKFDSLTSWIGICDV